MESKFKIGDCVLINEKDCGLNISKGLYIITNIYISEINEIRYEVDHLSKILLPSYFVDVKADSLILIETEFERVMYGIETNKKD